VVGTVISALRKLRQEDHEFEVMSFLRPSIKKFFKIQISRRRYLMDAS
jgi:hypothetical protein